MVNDSIIYNSFEEGFTKKASAFIYYKSDSETERNYMDHAIKMATLSQSGDKEETFMGEKVPDPKIGALLVFDDKVYCAARSGFKHGDHAEFTILETMNAPQHLDDGVLYTTLEPCTPESRKRNESCSEIIVNRRIKKVYIGSLDSNPLVLGRGVNYLLEHGVEIKFFDASFKDELNALNKEFFEFCKNSNDVKLIKMVDEQLGKYIDPNAVRLYMRKNFKDDMQEPRVEDYVSFYRVMLRKEQIIKGNFDNCVTCTKDFALAFFKKPSLRLSGYNSGIITFNSGKKKDVIDSSIISLFDSEHPNNIFELLCDALEIEKKEDVSCEEIIKNHFSKKFTFFREMLINAFVHNDYSSNNGVSISIKDSNIMISNIVSSTFFDLPFGDVNGTIGEQFQKYDSIPFNPSLMSFLYEAGLVENTNFGMQEFNKIKGKDKVISYNKKQNIVTISIPYK